MNLNKSVDYFNPSNIKERIHIIGCGSVGSCIAMFLVRAGLTKIMLWDEDIVEPHNLCNQMFTVADFGKKKTDALRDYLLLINPEAANDIKVMGNYNGQNLSGYVFLAVDNIEVRAKIAKENQYNTQIKMMSDVRTSLEEVNVYAAEWKDRDAVKNFIASMDYSHEDAKKEEDMTACGMVLGVMPTVMEGSLRCVTNWMNFVNVYKGVKKSYCKKIFISAFNNFNGVFGQ